MKWFFIGRILICRQLIVKEAQLKVLLAIFKKFYFFLLNSTAQKLYLVFFRICFGCFAKSGSKITTLNPFLFFGNLLGRDAAFIGPNENQFAILDDDKTALALYILPGMASKEVGEKSELVEENESADAKVGSVKGPMQFMFETEVDRIFSTPLGASGKCPSFLVLINKDASSRP